MAKVSTKAVSVSKKVSSKANGKPGKNLGHRVDKAARITPFTARFNLKADPKAPVKIIGTQGVGHGMQYAVSLPGAKETVGITRALVILGYAGFDRKALRLMCDKAGQPEIRDMVIQRYAGAGRGQAEGKLTGQIAPLSKEEKAMVAKGKAALAYYVKASAK